MKLALDGSGGFAGDMFTAALIDAGADYNTISSGMVKAGEKIGNIKIDLNKTEDGSTQLIISLEAEKNHVDAEEIKELLNESFEELNIGNIYREFGRRVLDILIDAENEAHTMQVFEKLMHHHGHTHNGAVLHEAQDIMIDIIGAVSGMELLGISPSASLIEPVRTGQGEIEFSHGILDVPAPATRIILDKFKINWEKGPIDTELCTPTGASLLAALIDKKSSPGIEKLKILGKGSSRGTKILPIPPLKIYLV